MPQMPNMECVVSKSKEVTATWRLPWEAPRLIEPWVTLPCLAQLIDRRATSMAVCQGPMHGECDDDNDDDLGRPEQ